MIVDRICYFIISFKYRNPSYIDDLYKDGFCYWFSQLLYTKFGGDIYYNELSDEYALKKNGVLYNVNGIIPYWNYDKYTLRRYRGNGICRRSVQENVQRYYR